VPVVPIDAGLVIPMVHADDVADAIARILEARAPGAFNLAAEPPVTAQDVADALGARLVHVPSGVVRAAVSASWHARVQPLDPGWIDLGYAVPLLDTARARTELGWAPVTDAATVLAETLAGMQDSAWSGSAVLRPRTVGGGLLRGWFGVRLYLVVSHIENESQAVDEPFNVDIQTTRLVEPQMPDDGADKVAHVAREVLAAPDAVLHAACCNPLVALAHPRPPSLSARAASWGWWRHVPVGV